MRTPPSGIFIECGLEELLKNTSLRQVSVGLGLLRTPISFCVSMDRRSVCEGVVWPDPDNYDIPYCSWISDLSSRLLSQLYKFIKRNRDRKSVSDTCVRHALMLWTSVAVHVLKDKKSSLVQKSKALTCAPLVVDFLQAACCCLLTMVRSMAKIH